MSVNFHDIREQDLRVLDGMQTESQFDDLKNLCEQGISKEWKNRDTAMHILYHEAEADNTFPGVFYPTLQRLTETVAKRAIATNSNGKNKLFVNIEKAILPLFEDNYTHKLMFNWVKTPEIKKELIEKISIAVKSIFESAGCKGELKRQEDALHLHLSWSDKSIFLPKRGITSPDKDQFTGFNDLREKGLFLDCYFNVDGQKVPAHKLVLCAHSEVFSTMFTSNFSESVSGKINVQYGLSTVNLFLDYIYKGRITINLEDFSEIFNLIKMAGTYQVNNLVQECWDIVVKRLSIFNVFEMYAFAEEVESEFIKSKCKIFCHDPKIQNHELDFSEFRDAEFANVLRIAKELNLSVAKETSLFTSVMSTFGEVVSKFR